MSKKEDKKSKDKKSKKNRDKEKSSSNKPKITKYKGKRVLVLNPADRFTFQFGVSKARLILKKLKHIKRFVRKAERKGW